jgi:signal transduction histidine kinase
MKIKYDKSHVLLIATTLAVIGLVIFQLTWMRHSSQLSDQIFNQRVYMALCSTVEEYGGGALCTKARGGDAPTCLPAPDTESNFVIPVDLVSDSTFNASLRQSLNFYQVDLDYDMTLSSEARPAEKQDEIYQCAIAIPSETNQESAFIHLSFADKEKFMLGRMPFMIVATILILMFTAIVLLFANWSLMKQKKLLETNVDFFNNMAHEFRTPLTNMGLAANMLVKKQKDLRGNDFVEIIKRENAKLLGQVERVLHLASVESGDYSLHKERLHLKSLLAGVQEEMHMQIKERQAIVRLDGVSEGLEVFGDRVHLGNVFRNLLDNALKYSNGNPGIRISAIENAKGIIVSVEDNGIGIPAGQCELIFEKFQRAGQGDLHERKGFGLGLAYVKRMVELHNGSVRVDSEVNKGSRFDVFLPLT